MQNESGSGTESGFVGGSPRADAWSRYPCRRIVSAIAAAVFLALFLVAKLPGEEIDGSGAASNEFLSKELQRISDELERLRSETSKTGDTTSKWAAPKFDGRIYFDAVAVAGQNEASRETHGNIANATGVREIRFALSGSGFETFRYRLQISLSPQDGRVGLLDNWVAVDRLPFFGQIRVGHQKPKSSLSYTASRIGDMTPIFLQGRRLGVSATRLFANDRLRFNYGMYLSENLGTDRFIEQDHQGRIAIVRLTGTPIYLEGGRKIVHLGIHFSETVTQDGKISLNARPGSIRFLDTTLRTGDFDCDRYRVLGLESTVQRGPFAIQSEIFLGRYSSAGDSPGRNANGGYVELKYFLTGEHREYRTANAAFGPPVTKRKLHSSRTGNRFAIDDFGAWQAIVQYCLLDFDDWRENKIEAGVQQDLVVGVNWFLSRDVRWTFEYVRSSRNTGLDRRYCAEDIFGSSIRVHY